METLNNEMTNKLFLRIRNSRCNLAKINYFYQKILYVDTLNEFNKNNFERCQYANRIQYFFLVIV